MRTLREIEQFYNTQIDEMPMNVVRGPDALSYFPRPNHMFVPARLPYDFFCIAPVRTRRLRLRAGGFDLGMRYRRCAVAPMRQLDLCAWRVPRPVRPRLQFAEAVWTRRRGTR